MRRALPRFSGLALLAAALVAVIALAIPGLAEAQGTGGSFGGGDWSSGGGSNGGGGSSHHDDEGAAWMLFMLFRVLVVTVGPIPALIIVALIGLGYLFVRSRNAARPFAKPLVRPPAASSPLWNQVDVTAVHIALDWRARGFVQKRYAELARGASARDHAGLAKHVAAIAQAVAEARVAWLRAEVSNFHPMSASAAEPLYQQLSSNARRAVEGDASGIADPGEHASEGAVVVSIIVAAKRELVDVSATDANQLAHALAGLEQVQARDLVAADLVWSPLAEGTRLSARELETRHPGMVRIEEHSIGARVFCTSCRAPYPRELPRCPGCGTENRG